MITTLRDLAVGDQGRVTGLDVANCAHREKLMSMGLTRGAHLTVKRVAPLGDPVEIRLRGFALTLRRADAHGIKIEKLGD
ncbi:MAG: ferrous iron transport protein A [Cohaesibacter sp.]|nr:ferrous iron transport protein A [Cohaesibacter sp.]